MENNILFSIQDTYTITPLIFAALLSLMIITKKWRTHIEITLYLAFNGVWTSLVWSGYLEGALWLLSAVSVLVVGYILFRRVKK